MPFVTVEVDASEVLAELSVDELREELNSRSELPPERRSRLLEEIYQHFRNRCPCEALRQFIGDETGKIL